MNAINQIIASIKSSQPNVNPTEVFNEGWMTRLLVHYSVQEKLKLPKLDFGSIQNWTSEALISSPFVSAPKLREGYTHADMALGDFSVRYSDGGNIAVNDDAKIFGIIEAKMRSRLTPGTTHFERYNQASRNVACIASNSFKTRDCQTFFAVVAPEKKLVEHKIDFILSNVVDEIRDRFNVYNPPLENEAVICSAAARCDTWSISYEDWISEFNDVAIKKELNDFYEECKKWNRIK